MLLLDVCECWVDREDADAQGDFGWMDYRRERLPTGAPRDP